MDLLAGEVRRDKVSVLLPQKGHKRALSGGGGEGDLAEGVRFELTVPLPTRRISSPVH